MNVLEKLLKKRFWWVGLSLLFMVVIYLASLANFRIDLTSEKRFSLSNSTKKLLRDLEQPVQIDIYLTGDLSSGFKKLSVASDELLNEFKEYAKGNLQYRFIRPGEGLPDTLRYQVYDSLVRMGIKTFNNQVTTREGEEKTERLIFPAAMVLYDGRQIPVDMTTGKSGMDEESTLNYSEALLEFKFADAIDKLTRKEFPIVAYAAGNGEPLPPNEKIKDLFVSLSKNYRFGVVDVKSGRLNADSINALLIVKPVEAFTDAEKLKVDQFVMNGGKVIWFVDKLYAEMDSLLRVQSDFVAFDRNLNLDDILFKYGVRINGDLLQDLKSAKQPLVVGQVGNQPQIERLPFPYYPLLSSPSNHPVSKNLDDVLSIFPGSIDTVKA
jgi:gliding-associated putative ABC transporter substrate-binding component GldG